MRTECDITKTEIIEDLLKTPREKRDDNWKQDFFSNVKTASFKCGDPQVIKGPDGFPYFALHMPEPGQPFESFCISNMTEDFLLERGFGVAINPAGNAVDWVFTYGDIVNQFLRNEFYTKSDGVEIQNIEVITEDQKVLVAQPSELYLPKQTRNVLKSFLQNIGIANPKIMLISRPVDGTMVQELAFNIYREDFETDKHLNYYLQQLSWFLPRHYIILSVPKNSDLASGFMDL